MAKPKAQGQETTKTAIPIENANSKLCPVISQPTVANSAMLITTGTNIVLILSASFAIGAFVVFASSTSAIIFESVVSAPTCVAWNLNAPD